MIIYDEYIYGYDCVVCIALYYLDQAHMTSLTEEREKMLKKSIKRKIRIYRVYNMFYIVLVSLSVITGIIGLFVSSIWPAIQINNSAVSAAILIEFAINWSRVRNKIDNTLNNLELIFADYTELYNARITTELQYYDIIAHNKALTDLTHRIHGVTLDQDIPELSSDKTTDWQSKSTTTLPQLSSIHLNPL